MEVVAALGAWALGKFNTSLPWINHSSALQHPGIIADLGPKLSSGAQILFPDSPGFDVATARYSQYGAPNFTVVVQVAQEDDVAETIKYANAKDISFLAVSTAHGTIATLGGVQHGIEIWLDKLDSIVISGDGETATFGGGVKSKAVIDALWESGKQTVTGGCECVSLLGPGLGGGHGFLQGRYGLISDQFVSMRVVTADGTIRTVSSDSDADLWWAMQGAGHNFGVVTSVTSKIYDVPYDGLWSYENYIFTHDKVEGVYDRINRFSTDGGQAVDLVYYSTFFRNPNIDPANPVVALILLQQGKSTVDSAYTIPLRDLGPLVVSSGSGTYKDVPSWAMTAKDSPTCQKANMSNVCFPLSLQSYDIQAQRAAFDAFAKGTSETPGLNQSVIIFEGYPVQGVQAVPSESTAFPFREDSLLVAPLVVYSDPALNDKAREFGEGLREILFQASGQQRLHAYVNYASGLEEPEDWYGDEAWRLKKLSFLKDKYDPEGKFKFYGPVA
ncbi:FAD binding domain-containing protein [Aspergillus steynii IBT 23096]|uniref:FAD binding domain-containing protein n=1 Tax=Aspergillus steynii IBT 23096 TaxID=1392250 RepID=A0A2I2GE98_9EURO|nr:FAD binding domain-containing protein [Aspergillus steynii IBT 23096]PLB51157.1 FAD binding domain-containing protein [Aspergillus steynii IBT 23096]